LIEVDAEQLSKPCKVCDRGLMCFERTSWGLAEGVLCSLESQLGKQAIHYIDHAMELKNWDF